jgi:hypothetical protein
MTFFNSGNAILRDLICELSIFRAMESDGFFAGRLGKKIHGFDPLRSITHASSDCMDFISVKNPLSWKCRTSLKWI